MIAYLIVFLSFVAAALANLPTCHMLFPHGKGLPLTLWQFKKERCTARLSGDVYASEALMGTAHFFLKNFYNGEGVCPKGTVYSWRDGPEAWDELCCAEQGDLLTAYQCLLGKPNRIYGESMSNVELIHATINLNQGGIWASISGDMELNPQRYDVIFSRGDYTNFNLKAMGIAVKENDLDSTLEVVILVSDREDGKACEEYYPTPLLCLLVTETPETTPEPVFTSTTTLFLGCSITNDPLSAAARNVLTGLRALNALPLIPISDELTQASSYHIQDLLKTNPCKSYYGWTSSENSFIEWGNECCPTTPQTEQGCTKSKPRLISKKQIDDATEIVFRSFKPLGEADHVAQYIQQQYTTNPRVFDPLLDGGDKSQPISTFGVRVNRFYVSIYVSKTITNHEMCTDVLPTDFPGFTGPLTTAPMSIPVIPPPFTIAPPILTVEPPIFTELPTVTVGPPQIPLYTFTVAPPPVKLPIYTAPECIVSTTLPECIPPTTQTTTIATTTQPQCSPPTTQSTTTAPTSLPVQCNPTTIQLECTAVIQPECNGPSIQPETTAQNECNGPTVQPECIPSTNQPECPPKLKLFLAAN